MLPGMAETERIAIVGVGNLGSAMAVSLTHAGLVVDMLVAHSPRSLKKAKALAKKIGARATCDFAGLNADLFWLCVPDSEIGRVARTLAEKLPWKGRVVFHSSGALTSDELSSLRRKGAAAASVHPMLTFVRGTEPALKRVPFAIEGDPAAVHVARRIVKAMGGRSYSIRKADKAAYHAWGTFASPLITALLATTERVALLAKVKPSEARKRMSNIILATVRNYIAFGAPGAFSGPIIRGDVETIRRHLRALNKEPSAREVYTALARAALEYLPAKNRNTLRQMLASGR